MPYLNKIITLVALIGALAGLHVWDKEVAVSKAKTATTLAIQNAYQQQIILQNIANQKRQEEIEKQSFNIVKEKDDKLKSLNVKLNSALISLQQRPSSTSTEVTDQTVASSCTGRELYREHAEFLTREAFRAEALITQRNYYYNEYENIRKQLNEN